MEYLKTLERLASDPVLSVRHGVFSESGFKMKHSALCKGIHRLDHERRQLSRTIRLQKASTHGKKESMHKCSLCNTKVDPTMCFTCKLPFTHCICVHPEPNHITRHHVKQCRSCMNDPKNTDADYTSFMGALKEIPSWLLFIRMLLPTLVESEKKRTKTLEVLAHLHGHVKVLWKSNLEDPGAKKSLLDKLGISTSTGFFLFGLEPKDTVYPIDPDRAEVVSQKSANSDIIKLPFIASLKKMSLRGPDVKTFVHQPLQSIYFVFHDEFGKKDFDPNVFLQKLDTIDPVLCMAFIMYLRVSRMRIPENTNSSHHLWANTNPTLNYDNVAMMSMKKLDAILVFYSIFFWVPSFSADALSVHVNEPILRVLRTPCMSTSAYFKSNTKWRSTIFPVTNDPNSLVMALSILSSYMPCDLPLSFVRTAFRHTKFLQVAHMFARLHASRFAMSRIPQKIDTTPEIRRLGVLLQFMLSAPGKFRDKCKKMIRGTKLFLETQTLLWKAFLEEKPPSQDLVRRCLLMNCDYSLSKFQATKNSMKKLNLKQEETEAKFVDIATAKFGTLRVDLDTSDALGIVVDPDLDSDKEDQEVQEVQETHPEDHLEVFDLPEPVEAPKPVVLTDEQKQRMRDEQTFKVQPEPAYLTNPHMHRHAFLSSSEEDSSSEEEAENLEICFDFLLAKPQSIQPPLKRTCL